MSAMADQNVPQTAGAERPNCTVLTALEIMRACRHDGPRESQIRDRATGTTVYACHNCGNAAIMAHRAARKLELAARPKDCQRCGRKPHTWNYGGYRLCGTCKKLTAREHFTQAAKHGALAIFATSPLVDTSSWAGRQKAGA